MTEPGEYEDAWKRVVADAKRTQEERAMKAEQRAFDWEREDVLAARVARDAGIERAERGSGAWQLDALNAIRRVARALPEFTTDDVWRELGRSPDIEGRAMGAAMRTAARMGICAKTDRTVKSLRTACHRRDLRIWRARMPG